MLAAGRQQIRVTQRLDEQIRNRMVQKARVKTQTDTKKQRKRQEILLVFSDFSVHGPEPPSRS